MTKGALLSCRTAKAARSLTSTSAIAASECSAVSVIVRAPLTRSSCEHFGGGAEFRDEMRVWHRVFRSALHGAQDDIECTEHAWNIDVVHAGVVGFLRHGKAVEHRQPAFRLERFGLVLKKGAATSEDIDTVLQ